MTSQDFAPLLTEGESRLAAEDWDGAVAVLRRAVEAEPSSSLAHSKLGIAYAHKRQWEEARAEFTLAIQLDPSYAPAHSNLGNVHREQGRLDEAIACYKKAILIDPQYWIAHQNLGVAYRQQGRLDDAVREFKVSARLSFHAKPGGGSAVGMSSGPVGSRTGARLGCLGTGAAAIFSTALVATVLRSALR